MQIDFRDRLENQIIREGIIGDFWDLSSLVLGLRPSRAADALHLRSNIRTANEQEHSLVPLKIKLGRIEWDLRFHSMGEKYRFGENELWITSSGIHFGQWGEIESMGLIKYHSSIRDTRIPLAAALHWLDSGVTLHGFKEDLRSQCEILRGWTEEIIANPAMVATELHNRRSVMKRFDIVSSYKSTIEALERKW